MRRTLRGHVLLRAQLEKIPIVNALYMTKVAATGVRHGHIRSEEGLLNPCENFGTEIDS